jgi:hypothetical protein
MPASCGRYECIVRRWWPRVTVDADALATFGCVNVASIARRCECGGPKSPHHATARSPGTRCARATLHSACEYRAIVRRNVVVRLRVARADRGSCRCEQRRDDDVASDRLIGRTIGMDV